MWFTIVGEIHDIEPIALGRSVRVRLRLGRREFKIKRFVRV